MPYTPTAWNDNSAPDIDATNLNKIESALVTALANSGVSAGTYTLATITVTADGKITSAASGAPGAVADASTTVKGAAKMSVAPALSTSPIAVGDNDTRVASATTTTSGITRLSVAPITNPISLGQNDPALESYITGFELQRDGNTALTVKAGAAWIPFLGRVYNAPSDISLPSMSMSASTWYYLYLYDSSGTPSIELSSTAPTTPYKGLARTKTSDTSRRFIAAIRSNASSQMYNWVWENDGWMRYIADTRSTSAGSNPQHVFEGTMGSASVYANVSLAALVPPTSQLAMMQIKAGSGSEWNISIPGQSTAMHTVATSTRTPLRVDLDSSQQYAHLSPDSSAGAASHFLLGYKENR